MNNEQLKSEILKNEADEFWANCEAKAAELEPDVFGRRRGRRVRLPPLEVVVIDDDRHAEERHDETVVHRDD